MKYTVTIFLSLLVLLCVVGPAFADDVQIGTPAIPIVFAGTGDGVLQQFQHMDLAPFKGWANIYVYNSSNVAWGDFHFQIFSFDQSDVSQVDFISGGIYNPTSSQALGSWSINNSPATGAMMNLYFYSDPVLPGHLANFQVYTDNTATHANFGLAVWPTPVPEPGSLLALSSGLIGIAGLALKKRR
jgi:hypothetical protein